MITSSADLAVTWQSSLPEARVSTYSGGEDNIWPHGLIGDPGELLLLLRVCTHSPGWCITVGESAPPFSAAMAARFLKPWGLFLNQTFYGSEKFRRALPNKLGQDVRLQDPDTFSFATAPLALDFFRAGVQNRLARSYEDMGSSLLKHGADENDFTDVTLLSSVNAVPFGDLVSET